MILYFQAHKNNVCINKNLIRVVSLMMGEHEDDDDEFFVSGVLC